MKRSRDLLEKNLIPKITALWAFSESGLGGMLHAVRLPFSGIFLASISVILISFLAFHSQTKWKTILQAFVLVLILKITISPHSPITAYIALSFQAFLGAILYQIFGFHRWVVLLFSIISLLETAFQKILTLTILIGMKGWDAFYSFFFQLAQDAHIPFFQSIPEVLIIGYIFIYLITSIVVGFFAYNLPENIQEQAATLEKLNIDDKEDSFNFNSQKKKSRWVIIIGLIILISSLYVFQNYEVLYIVVRSLIVIILFLYIIQPIFLWILNRWLKHSEKKYQQNLTEILSFIPQIQQNVTIAYRLSQEVKNPFLRAKEFLLNWFAISIYFESK